MQDVRIRRKRDTWQLKEREFWNEDDDKQLDIYPR